MPEHDHGASGSAGKTSTAGIHTHARGTMNIIGEFASDDKTGWHIDGAFYKKQDADCGSSGGGSGGYYAFNAARAWTGNTSESGDHSHAIDLTINKQGGGKPHQHKVSIDTKINANSVPAFYSLAYFVKVLSA